MSHFKLQFILANMENLRFTLNQLFKSVKEVFLVTEKFTEDHREVTSLTTIDYKQPS